MDQSSRENKISGRFINRLEKLSRKNPDVSDIIQVMVEDSHAKRASNIVNDGLRTQLDCLGDEFRYSEDDIMKYLDDCIPGWSDENHLKE